MQGRDMGAVLNKSQDMSLWRNAVFMEDLFLVDMFRKRYKENIDELNENLIKANKSYRSHGIRTDRWKYLVYYEHTPKVEELYDIDNDPFEQQNLVNNSLYIETLIKLRRQTEEMYRKVLP